jgi:uncharacterized protein with HEPN domain
MIPKNDQHRMRHMLEAAREAVGYAKGRSREDLDRDTMLTRAILQCVAVLGEAASRVSRETRAQTPTLPWPQIVGMRNRIIHAYFDINLDEVWGTVVTDLPALERELSKFLESA